MATTKTVVKKAVANKTAIKKPVVKKPVAKTPKSKPVAKKAVKSAKKSSPTVYWAALSFYIPRKGGIVNDVRLNSDYSLLVKDILKLFSHYVSSDFEIIRVRTKGKAYHFEIDHVSWEKEPFKIELRPEPYSIQQLINHCLYEATENGNPMMDCLLDDDYIDRNGMAVTEGEYTLK